MDTRRILLVCRGVPNTPRSGAQVRARQTAEALERFGLLDILVASPNPFPPEQIREMHNRFNVVRSVKVLSDPLNCLPNRLRHELDPSFMNTDGFVASLPDREWLDLHLADYDIIWIHSMVMANLFRIYKWPRSVMDLDDIRKNFYYNQMRIEKQLLKKISCARQVWLWGRREQRLFKRFNVVTVCSDSDRMLFEKNAPVFVIPNGFPPDKTTQRHRYPQQRIGFIGNLGYAPNLEGLQWFLREVWLIVKHGLPTAEFRIIGENSGQLDITTTDGVTPLGWVSDVKAEVSTWAAFVIPIRFGGGTSVKVAEAIARTCPIVSTSFGIRGFDLQPGKHVLIGDTPQSLAKACLLLLQNHQIGNEMAQRAKWNFEDKHSPEAIGLRVIAAAEECARRRYA